MPKFPFNDEQVEAVTTFVLGLVAEPPPTEYLYQPEGRPADVIEGERLLDKYNCGGCHIIDLPKIAFAANLDDLADCQGCG
jgi:mono/diheme cytochrome c family protein